MPPDSRSASRARNGVSCVISSSRSRRGRVVAHAVNLGEERDVLVDAEIAVQAEALREIADRVGERAMLADRIDAEHADRGRRRPRSRPQISRIVVVLPAPSGPISPNISPGRPRATARATRRPSRRSASVTRSSVMAAIGSCAVTATGSRLRPACPTSARRPCCRPTPSRGRRASSGLRRSARCAA